MKNQYWKYHLLCKIMRFLTQDEMMVAMIVATLLLGFPAELRTLSFLFAFIQLVGYVYVAIKVGSRNLAEGFLRCTIEPFQRSHPIFLGPKS
jgi:hypothetical protein